MAEAEQGRVNQEYESIKDMYLYLDFNGRVDMNEFENSNTFFRVADLDKTNPLIQVNDMTFKGSYENCDGNNLFFTVGNSEEQETDFFKKNSSLSLTYLTAQFKILNLEPINMQISELSGDENKEFNLNLSHKYKTTLKKFEKGELKLEDLIKKNRNTSMKKTVEQNVTVTKSIEKNENKELEISGNNTEIVVCNSTESEISISAPSNIRMDPPSEHKKPSSLLKKYNKLKILAKRPVHRRIEEEKVMDCDNKYNKAFEYHNIERRIFQRGDSFPTIDFEVEEQTLKNLVDIDRCVLHGILPSSKLQNPSFSQEERQLVLKMENFHLLSLPARYIVLKNELNKLISYAASAEADVSKTDEFGHTIKDTIEIVEKLVHSLGSYLSTLKKLQEETQVKIEVHSPAKISKKMSVEM